MSILKESIIKEYYYDPKVRNSQTGLDIQFKELTFNNTIIEISTNILLDEFISYSGNSINSDDFKNHTNVLSDNKITALNLHDYYKEKSDIPKKINISNNLVFYFRYKATKIFKNLVYAYYVLDDNLNNILTNVIPYNYDNINYTYQAILEKKNNSNIYRKIPLYSYPFYAVIDYIHGYLFFYEKNVVTKNKLQYLDDNDELFLTFIRYEGNFGAVTGGDSTTIPENLLNIIGSSFELLETSHNNLEARVETFHNNNENIINISGLSIDNSYVITLSGEAFDIRDISRAAYNSSNTNVNSEFVNNANPNPQTFFEIMTQQPNAFNKIGSKSNDPVTIDICWNYDNILAKNEGNIMYNNNADNKLYKKLIPHIDSIVFEISGNVTNGQSYNWQKIYNISFGDTYDASNILYTDIVKHTLTNTQTYVSDFAQSVDGFQVRVYGINDASNNPPISDRAIIFDVSFNTGATIKPTITSMTSTTISGDINSQSNPNATINIDVEPNGSFTTNEISYNYTSTVISNNSQLPNENYINNLSNPIYDYSDNPSKSSNTFNQNLSPLYSGRDYSFNAQVKTTGSGNLYSDVSTINFSINKPNFTHPSINSISNFFNTTSVINGISSDINYIVNPESNINIKSDFLSIHFPVTDDINYGYIFSGNSHASLTIDVDNIIKTGVNYNTWDTNGQLSYDYSANHSNYFSDISISDYATNKHNKGYYIKGSYTFNGSIEASDISSNSNKDPYNFKVTITNKVSPTPTTIITEDVYIDNLTQDASINLNGSISVTNDFSYNIFGITYKNNFDLSGNFNISNANGICKLFAQNAIEFTDTLSSSDNNYIISTTQRNLLNLINPSDINSHGNYSIEISNISINDPINQRTGAINNINFRAGIKNLYQTNYSYNNINYSDSESWYYDSLNISKYSDLTNLNIYQFENTIISTGSSPSLTELSNSLIEMKLDNSANNYTMGFRYGVFDSDENHEAMSSADSIWDDLSYGTVKNKTLDIDFNDSLSNNNYKWIIFKIDFTNEYGYSSGNNTFNIDTLFEKLCINTNNIKTNLIPTSNNVIGLIHLYNSTNNYWGILNNNYIGSNKWFENQITTINPLTNQPYNYNDIKNGYGVNNSSNVNYDSIQLNSIDYSNTNYKCFIYIGVKNKIA